jgi:hypothetical protein
MADGVIDRGFLALVDVVVSVGCLGLGFFVNLPRFDAPRLGLSIGFAGPFESLSPSSSRPACPFSSSSWSLLARMASLVVSGRGRA